MTFGRRQTEVTARVMLRGGLALGHGGGWGTRATRGRSGNLLRLTHRLLALVDIAVKQVGNALRHPSDRGDRMCDNADRGLYLGADAAADAARRHFDRRGLGELG